MWLYSYVRGNKIQTQVIILFPFAAFIGLRKNTLVFLQSTQNPKASPDFKKKVTKYGLENSIW
jgi:hypothetical protein